MVPAQLSDAPFLEVESVAALNDPDLECMLEQTGIEPIRGKQMSVGEASEQERASLLPLVKEGLSLLEEVEGIYPLIVDSHCRVKVKTNWYSAPASPGMRVGAVVGPSWIEIKHPIIAAWRSTSAATDGVTRF